MAEDLSSDDYNAHDLCYKTICEATKRSKAEAEEGALWLEAQERAVGLFWLLIEKCADQRASEILNDNASQPLAQSLVGLLRWSSMNPHMQMQTAALLSKLIEHESTPETVDVILDSFPDEPLDGIGTQRDGGGIEQLRRARRGSVEPLRAQSAPPSTGFDALLGAMQRFSDNPQLLKQVCSF